MKFHALSLGLTRSHENSLVSRELKSTCTYICKFYIYVNPEKTMHMNSLKLRLFYSFSILACIYIFISKNEWSWWNVGVQFSSTCMCTFLIFTWQRTWQPLSFFLAFTLGVSKPRFGSVRLLDKTEPFGFWMSKPFSFSVFGFRLFFSVRLFFGSVRLMSENEMFGLRFSVFGLRTSDYKDS